MDNWKSKPMELWGSSSIIVMTRGEKHGVKNKQAKSLVLPLAVQTALSEGSRSTQTSDPPEKHNNPISHQAHDPHQLLIYLLRAI